METRITKATLLVFVLSSTGYKVSANVSIETSFQYAHKNSCLNGGTRIDLVGEKYRCDCANGFTGTICETESQCGYKNSCLNGGTRMDLPDGTYRCHCVSGFTGIICETAFQCPYQNSCLNGGAWMDPLAGAYIGPCMCGFTGNTCEQPKPQCACKNSCLNGGTRIELPDGTYRCHCGCGFTGTICETHSCTTPPPPTKTTTTIRPPPPPTTTTTPMDITTTDETSREITTTDDTSREITTTDETLREITTTDETSREITTDETSREITTTDETSREITTTDETPQEITTTDDTSREITTTVKTTTVAGPSATGCRRYIDELEEYTGDQTWTFTKKTCQRWDSQSPHSHHHTDASKYTGPIQNVSEAENYCRNPDGRFGGAWCFTTNSTKRWEYCGVPFCHGCKRTQKGKEYNGTKNWTNDPNNKCLYWEDVQHPFKPANFSGGITNLSQAENYCRNPGPIQTATGKIGPWCYVHDPLGWGVKPVYCGVPFCHACIFSGSYGGTMSTTKSGLTCQRWDSQSPHPHNVTDHTTFKITAIYNITHVNEAENYCQIIDGVNRTKHWCYTTSNSTEWEYCDVPNCP